MFISLKTIQTIIQNKLKKSQRKCLDNKTAFFYVFLSPTHIDYNSKNDK